MKKRRKITKNSISPRQATEANRSELHWGRSAATNQRARKGDHPVYIAWGGGGTGPVGKEGEGPGTSRGGEGDREGGGGE